MSKRLVAALVLASTFSFPALSSAESPRTAATADVQTGVASYYSRRFEGRRTANGETFRNDGLTAAHASLPFGTIVMVTCLEQGRSVMVRITDRLPAKTAIIDLTQKAAAQLNMIDAGRRRVTVQVVEWGKGQAQALRQAAQQAPAALSAATDVVVSALTDDSK